MKVAMYARVATLADSGPTEATEAQEIVCREYAEAHGLTVAGSFRDAPASGIAALEARSGLTAALAEIEAGRASVLAVSRWDRIARSETLLRQIVNRVEAAGGRIVSVDGAELSPRPSLMELVSAYERELISRKRKRAGKCR